MLPTPTLGHIRNYDEDPQDYFDRVAKFESGEYNGKPGISLGVAVKLLPTPTVSDTFTDNLKSSQQTPGSMHSVTLPQAVKLLPTPMTTDYKQTDCEGNWNRHSPPLGTIVHDTNWGRFQPAIHQWEQVTGRQAPPPTKPDGKDGQHRLSAEFTEWLMGLPQGWLTNIGLKRNDELKACGNGVVPQQAALALSLLDPQENHG